MIRGEVLNTDRIIARIVRANVAVRHEVAGAVRTALVKLQRYVITEKLNAAPGPDPERLHVRTGRLWRSVTVKETGELSGTVGTNVEYARRHEFGFSGVEVVRAHTRRITSVFGRPVGARDIVVNAHSRNANTPARHMFRNSLQELRPEILSDFRQAVVRGLR